METIVLIGNGFDLYHKLPTKYSNFLNVANYLLENPDLNPRTVGDVFSQNRVQEEDDFIRECYETHKQAFDDTKISSEDISRIIGLLQNNRWFLYLKRSFNKANGWIDFEKEISFVVKSLRSLLQSAEKKQLVSVERHVKFIGKFFEVVCSFSGGEQWGICPEYYEEYPRGSANLIVNKKKVSEALEKELSNFAEALRLYLECFVDNVFDHWNDDFVIPIEMLNTGTRVVTFNYTNLFEKIYFAKNVYHIHGNIGGKIVLGINHSEFDLSENEVTFVGFEKQFQRTLYDTDVEYSTLAHNLNNGKLGKYQLIVMGHSLDVSDRDIIEDMFCGADEIAILYHDIAAKKTYIENLVKIFGKNVLTTFKKEKKLSFISLQDMKAMANFTSEHFQNRIDENNAFLQGFGGLNGEINNVHTEVPVFDESLCMDELKTTDKLV